MDYGRGGSRSIRIFRSIRPVLGMAFFGAFRKSGAAKPLRIKRAGMACCKRRRSQDLCTMTKDDLMDDGVQQALGT